MCSIISHCHHGNPWLPTASQCMVGWLQFFFLRPLSGAGVRFPLDTMQPGLRQTQNVVAVSLPKQANPLPKEAYPRANQLPRASLGLSWWSKWIFCLEAWRLTVQLEKNSEPLSTNWWHNPNPDSNPDPNTYDYHNAVVQWAITRGKAYASHLGISAKRYCHQCSRAAH